MIMHPDHPVFLKTVLCSEHFSSLLLMIFVCSLFDFYFPAVITKQVCRNKIYTIEVDCVQFDHRRLHSFSNNL